MTKKEQKAEMYRKIEDYGKALLVLFPNARIQEPIKLCKALRALENKVSRANEDRCNIADFDSEGKMSEKAIERLIKILNPEKPEILHINQDPRGFALKIDDKFFREAKPSGIISDWGGYGILAPDFSNSNH